MARMHSAVAAAALILLVAACGKAPAKDAGVAVQALLTAVQTGDTQAFEAGVDRPALRADLRRQMIAVGQQAGLDVGGPSDSALDRMIGPDAFHLTLGGAPLAAPPSTAQVTAQLKPVAKDRVCLRALDAAQACLLTFARENGAWRLVAMPADHPAIELAPEPAKK